MLTINDYQKKAHTTADYLGMKDGDYRYPVMGLAEEAGEVSGKFAKAVRDNNGVIDEERKTAIKKNLGMFSGLSLKSQLCLALLLKKLQSNLDKLASRKARGVIHGSGDDR